MTLHPDILTDLIILYHAGEASQATRALLEQEASVNPQVAAALAATPPTARALPAYPAAAERKVFRKVRLRYQAISFGIVWTLVLLVIALLPRFLNTTGLTIAINLLPFAVLILVFTAAVAALYFFIRAVIR